MTLRIIAAGGTFDKHYDEISGRLDFADSHLPEVIARARLNLPVAFEPLFLLDSLDMTDADRTRLAEACAKAPENQLVIVHGTDTMPETARVLADAGLNKTIVLTGAMVPYEMTHSDGLFNFGFACCAAQTLPAGVYVAMNGRVFDGRRVRKNKTEGIFEAS